MNGMRSPLRRRDLLASTAAWGASAGLGAVVGCGREPRRFSCMDTTGLPPDAVALRTSPAVAYTDAAIDPAKTCTRCQQFIAPPSGAGCGSCKVLKGPVHPNGGCRLFAPKMA
jgi:hypothetical protein